MCILQTRDVQAYTKPVVAENHIIPEMVLFSQLCSLKLGRQQITGDHIHTCVCVCYTTCATNAKRACIDTVDNSVLSPSPNCTSGDRLQSDNMYLLLWTGCDVVVSVIGRTFHNTRSCSCVLIIIVLAPFHIVS
jgi:hypothetical protein